MSNKDQKIIDKIMKLRAKAESSGSTEAEAQAFGAKVAQLMEEYAVSSSDLHERPDHINTRYIMKDINPWRRNLMFACAHASFCEIITYKSVLMKGKIDIVGRPLNGRVCVETYEFIERQVVKIARQLYPKDTKSARRAEGGLAQGVGWKLRESKASTQESRMPVVQERKEVGTALDELHPTATEGNYRQPRCTEEHLQGQLQSDRIKLRADI